MSAIRNWLKRCFRVQPDKQGNGLQVKRSRPEVPTYSEQQKQDIRKCWTELQNEIYHVGVVSFINFIENTMEFRRSFVLFKDMTAEEVRNSPLVKAHAMSILHVIEQLVGRIDDTDKWHNVVAELAKRHAGKNVVPSVAIDVAGQCWKSIESILRNQGKYGEETEKLWTPLIQWLGEAMEYYLLTVQ